MIFPTIPSPLAPGEVVSVSHRIGDRLLSLDVGRVGPLADAAVFAKFGETSLLVSAVSGWEASSTSDFLPLQVDYREKSFAGGFIPGTRNRRETSSSDRETLAARAIDRTVRPLFPKGFAADTQLLCSVMSFDPDCDTAMLSIIASSAALMVSNIPFKGPAAAVKVGWLEGRPILAPTEEEEARSSLSLLYSGMLGGRTLMMEAGGGEISEGKFVEAARFAQASLAPLLDMQLKLAARVGKPKKIIPPVLPPPELLKAVRELIWEDAQEMYRQHHFRKHERGNAQRLLFIKIKENLKDVFPPSQHRFFGSAGSDVMKAALREAVSSAAWRSIGNGVVAREGEIASLAIDTLDLQRFNRAIDPFTGKVGEGKGNVSGSGSTLPSLPSSSPTPPQPPSESLDTIIARALRAEMGEVASPTAAASSATTQTPSEAPSSSTSTSASGLSSPSSIDESSSQPISTINEAPLVTSSPLATTGSAAVVVESVSPPSAGTSPPPPLLLLDASGCRPDGRSTTDIRKIRCQVDTLPLVHGSSIFSRGDTQVICTATLAPVDQAQIIRPLSGSIERKSFFLHYDFPPYCTNEVGRVGGANRRMVGHGALAEKAILPVIPSESDFPYAVRATSEVSGSDGSSSMATVCGVTLALLDAGVPLKAPVAGISIGCFCPPGPDWEGGVSTHAAASPLVTTMETEAKHSLLSSSASSPTDSSGESGSAASSSDSGNSSTKGCAAALSSPLPLTQSPPPPYFLLTDIFGLEDHSGDMDFKIAGTREGITALQLDVKPAGIPLAVLEQALWRARDARGRVLDIMASVAPAPRVELKENAPRVEQLIVQSELLGKLIGPGGSNLRRIQTATGARILIDQTRQEAPMISIYAPSAALTAAKAMILTAVDDFRRVVGSPLSLVSSPSAPRLDVGTAITACVTKVQEYGVVLGTGAHELGWLHISEFSPRRTAKVSDFLDEGDEVTALVVDVDARGRARLSIRAMMTPGEMDPSVHIKRKTIAPPSSASSTSSATTGDAVVAGGAGVAPPFATPRSASSSAALPSSSSKDKGGSDREQERDGGKRDQHQSQAIAMKQGGAPSISLTASAGSRENGSISSHSVSSNQKRSNTGHSDIAEPVTAVAAVAASSPPSSSSSSSSSTAAASAAMRAFASPSIRDSHQQQYPYTVTMLMRQLGIRANGSNQGSPFVQAHTSPSSVAKLPEGPSSAARNGESAATGTFQSSEHAINADVFAYLRPGMLQAGVIFRTLLSPLKPPFSRTNATADSSEGESNPSYRSSPTSTTASPPFPSSSSSSSSHKLSSFRVHQRQLQMDLHRQSHSRQTPVSQQQQHQQQHQQQRSSRQQYQQGQRSAHNKKNARTYNPAFSSSLPTREGDKVTASALA